MTPSVAVILPTYNRSGYLALALESVLAQTLPASEIVVVDDGSTDDTAEVCARYPGVRYERQANAGQASARNTGIRLTTSEWLRFLDDDDLLDPTALERDFAVLAEHPEADLVYSRTLRINGEGKKVGEDLVHHRMPADPLTSLLEENFIRIQAVTVRRSAVEGLGGFDVEMVPCEDYELWIRMAAAGKRLVFSDHALARYRVHAGSVSRQSERMARALLKAVERHAGTAARAAGAHYRLGRTLLDLGRAAEAAVEFRLALAGKPGSLRYRAYLAAAEHPAAQQAVLRTAQAVKRAAEGLMVRLGLREQRWGKPG